MVVFTCGSCGGTVKKAQVEQHVMKCRSCQVLSCIDCGKDFRGDDYKDHIKCISEDQKYGGKDFKPKVNKGEVKQQEWTQRIQQAMRQPGIEPSLLRVLQMVSSHGNVPRKKAKFENWMAYSMKISNPSLLEKVWDICTSTASSTNNDTETNENKRDERKNKNNKKKRKTTDENSEEPNGENADEKQKRKKRKREEKEQNGHDADEESGTKQETLDESVNPEEEEEPENQESESNSTGKFNWKGTIKAVLRDAPEDGLAVKKLRKKVLAAYYSFTGDSNFRSEEEVLSLFNRKLNKNPKFRVLKDKVRLVK